MQMYNDKATGGRRTLPSCLSEPISAYQTRFLSQQMSNYLLAVNFNTEKPLDEILKEATSKKKSNEVEEEKKDGEKDEPKDP